MMRDTDGGSGHSPRNEVGVGNASCVLMDSRIERLPQDCRHVCVETKASLCICCVPQA